MKQSTEQRALDALVRMRDEVLTGPEKWTQGYLARTKGAGPIQPWNKDAVCFCLAGALDLVTHRGEAGNPGDWQARDIAHKELKGVLNRLPDAHLRDEYIHVWNDEPERTYEQVIELLDKTINHLQARVEGTP